MLDKNPTNFVLFLFKKQYLKSSSKQFTIKWSGFHHNRKVCTTEQYSELQKKSKDLKV